MKKSIIAINTLLASAGAGAITLLVLVVFFRMDYLKAFLLAYVAAIIIMVLNPLWLAPYGSERVRKGSEPGRRRKDA